MYQLDTVVFRAIFVSEFIFANFAARSIATTMTDRMTDRAIPIAARMDRLDALDRLTQAN